MRFPTNAHPVEMSNGMGSSNSSSIESRRLVRARAIECCVMLRNSRVRRKFSEGAEPARPTPPQRRTSERGLSPFCTHLYVRVARATRFFCLMASAPEQARRSEPPYARDRDATFGLFAKLIITRVHGTGQHSCLFSGCRDKAGRAGIVSKNQRCSKIREKRVLKNSKIQIAKF